MRPSYGFHFFKKRKVIKSELPLTSNHHLFSLAHTFCLEMNPCVGAVLCCCCTESIKRFCSQTSSKWNPFLLHTVAEIPRNPALLGFLVFHEQLSYDFIILFCKMGLYYPRNSWIVTQHKRVGHIDISVNALIS